MFTQRMKAAIAAGAVLGVFCIMGAWIRSGPAQGTDYFFSFWYNRLLMGVVIGLSGGQKGKPHLLRGAGLGFLVSFAFYSSTGFHDPMGFLAGIIYGMIIEFFASRYEG